MTWSNDEMVFTFGDRVVLLDTHHNRSGGHVGASGEVVGISHEHEDHGPHVGYAVTLDSDGLTHFVLPDGMERISDE